MWEYDVLVTVVQIICPINGWIEKHKDHNSECDH